MKIELYSDTEPKPAYISPEKYLLDEIDRAEGEKYEYVNGYIYIMSAVSRAHNRVVGNFAFALFSHLKPYVSS